MKHRLLVLFLTFATTTAFAQSAVNGRVTLADGSPAEGVKVLFESRSVTSETDSTTTDASGDYSLVVQNGAYDITYTLTGYEPEMLTDQLISGNTTLSTIVLKESVLVTGVVSLNTLDSLAGIEVHFEAADATAETTTAFTDASGNYSARITPGTYNISYSRTLFGTQTLSGVELLVPTTLDEITLTTNLFIEGRVIDESGNALDSVEVHFIPDFNQLGDSFKAYTNADGNFSVALTEGGDFAVNLSKEGYRPRFLVTPNVQSGYDYGTLTLNGTGVVEEVSGPVSGTWTNDRIYQVTDHAHVPVGQTLTLEPGTTVLIGRDKDFYVNGNLVAEGTASDSVYIIGDVLDARDFNVASDASMSMDYLVMRRFRRYVYFRQQDTININRSSFYDLNLTLFSSDTHPRNLHQSRFINNWLIVRSAPEVTVDSSYFRRDIQFALEHPLLEISSSSTPLGTVAVHANEFGHGNTALKLGSANTIDSLMVTSNRFYRNVLSVENLSAASYIKIHQNTFYLNRSPFENEAITVADPNSSIRYNIFTNSFGSDVILEPLEDLVPSYNVIFEENFTSSTTGFGVTTTSINGFDADAYANLLASPNLYTNPVEDRYLSPKENSPAIDYGDPDLLDPDGSRRDAGAVPYAGSGPGTLPAFSLLSPAAQQTVDGSASVVFEWEATTSTETITYTWTLEGPNGTETMTTRDTTLEYFGTLVAGESYTWQVSASDGSLTAQSNPRSFWAANEAPDAFALASPADGAQITTPTVTFAWEAAADEQAVTYSVSITGTDVDLTVDNLTELTTTVNASEFTIGTTYTWQVMASDGDLTRTSESRTFEIASLPPADFDLLAPANNATEVALTAVEFTWATAADDEAVTYRWVLNLGGFDATAETQDTTLTFNGSLEPNTSYTWYVEATDASGLTTTSDTYTFTTQEEVTGLADPKAISWTVYPNPAEDVLTLEWDATGPAQVQIITLQGKMIREVTLRSGSRMSLQGIPAGSYLLRLQEADGTAYAQRIVVGQR